MSTNGPMATCTRSPDAREYSATVSSRPVCSDRSRPSSLNSPAENKVPQFGANKKWPCLWLTKPTKVKQLIPRLSEGCRGGDHLEAWPQEAADEVASQAEIGRIARGGSNP